jgi:hypothetical protein
MYGGYLEILGIIHDCKDIAEIKPYGIKKRQSHF